MTIEYPPSPHSVAALLDLVRQTRASLNVLIDNLTEAEMLIALGDWSVKDHLAHITAWERRLLATLLNQPPQDAFGIDAATYSVSSTDQLNDFIYERERFRHLPVVAASYTETHRDLLTALGALTDADLATPFAVESGTMLEHIAVNTYEHYIEHETWIRAGLAKVKS
ncbi:MAG: ClbS/DfsB family four-helix bundle protein [Dehalococcoidia bacterium]|nr:ClbS/DfsB family four-helix bundle protein [Dehalococcoidia bacterium]